jgi:hypothetical protein
VDAVLTDGAHTVAGSRRFHFRMAALFMLIAFSGFYPTYWAKIASGAFHAPPIVHIHGMLLFTWTLFYFMQAALVASGRTPAHRAWGIVGVSLFSVLVCVIIVTKVMLMRLDELSGFGLETRRFSAVVFGALPLMIGLFAYAIANVRRPEIHKRVMLVLMAGMMTPAVARVFLTLLAPPGAADAGPPPPFVSIPPSLVGDLCVIGAMVYDWRTRGRPHHVYVYGLILLVVQPIVTVMIATTDAWNNIAQWIERLGG